MQDTVLYLLHEPGKHYKFTDTKGVDPITLKESWEDTYAYNNLFLYDGHPLKFISKDKVSRQRLQPWELKKLPVVTEEQLFDFISRNYPKHGDKSYYGGVYFRQLKHIFIVERNEGTGTPTVTEVRPLVDFE
ncbi:hypothetical protein GU926_16970 [Nibribacter ruber]|uniref:Uncharacterized protein n=1 Tax=Nibribacter ruber TaxID=2698458 RepID=A0A6P1P3W5_9BACT|nr:hypothetical protein [Nibribacter ruber]QHL89026.1 hypothetical protein GU926_16970 [Nibribacter ruber]